MTPDTVHILLIDDHPLVRDGLRLRLESVAHFRVVAEAGNADEAMARAAEQRIDLALLDVNLPGTNGIALCASLHAAFPSMALLMLSMHDKAEYVNQAMRAGARGYVLKDAPGKDIVAAIDTVMSGGIYHSAALARQLSLSPREAAPLQTILTAREIDVLRGIARGQSNKLISRELNLSVRTIETHRLNIKRKLGIDGQAELIRFAVERASLLGGEA